MAACGRRHRAVSVSSQLLSSSTVTCPASGCTGAPKVLADASNSSGLLVGDAQAIYWINNATAPVTVLKLAR